MFSPGTPNIFVLCDSVFMLRKCLCENISIEQKMSFLILIKVVTLTSGNFISLYLVNHFLF